MSNSPSYDAAMRQIKDLQETGMSPETTNKVYAAMATQASESQGQTVDEIKKLAKRAISMDQTFQSIKLDLGRVDQNNYKDKFGNPIAKLQPTWAKFQKRYTELLWASRTSATEAEAKLRDFLDVILPEVADPDIPLSDKVRDLDVFIQQAKIKRETQSQGFQELQTDVEKFTASFTSFANDEEVKLTDRIKELNTQIAALNKEITDCQKLITQLSIALGVTVGVAGVGIIAAVAALGPAAPAVVASILIAGIGAAIGEISQIIVNVLRVNSATLERNDKQSEVDKLNKDLEILGRVKSMLQGIADDSQEISGRLDGFSGIVDQVAHDAAYLKGAHPERVDKALLTRIDLMKQTYSALATALASYATTIDTSFEPTDDN